MRETKMENMQNKVHKDKRYIIKDKVPKIPQTKEEMVTSFMLEQERIQRMYRFIDLDREMLDAETSKLLGEIAKRRLSLYKRERNIMKREEANIAYGRKVNSIYKDAIIFDDGVNEDNGSDEEEYEQ